MQRKINKDIKPLTGLRFFAALFVCMAHVLPKFLTSVPEDVVRLSATGMTLFFVLSGFVIHYNYSNSIIKNKRVGLYNFFVARFARLYPLFIIGLLLEYYNMHGLHFDSAFWTAIPYYLTLTQSWVYFIIKNNALIYQFHYIGAVGWSVSTEWFFYVAYPLVCLALLSLTRISSKLFTMAAISFSMIYLVWFANMHTNEINQYGLAHFGPIADMNNGSQDSLYRWIVYFSPFARIAEFLMGCLIASIYMDLSHKEPSKRENQLGFFALIGFMLMAVVAHIMIFNATGKYAWMITLHQSFGFAIPVAGIIFCVARYKNVITRFLSYRVIMIGGEMSYSIYLLHLSIATHYHHLYTALPAVFLGAYVTYRVIEVPCRKILRNKLTIRHQPSDLVAVNAVT